MHIRHKNILKIPVAVTSYANVISQVRESIKDACGRYICVANVHMCMDAFDNIEFSLVVNNADLVVPDGMPLVWGLKALGEKDASQVRGSDLLLELCADAEKNNIPIGLYGGTPDSLDDFQVFLKRKFPLLPVSCGISPPFRPLTEQEDTEYIRRINNSNARILFVGIGCPKQEIWMAAHKEKLSCVMIGVGAAFDFFSRRKRHAPRWMRKAGIEWLFRFACEPRRLWKRYLKHNPRFVYFFVKQWLKERAEGESRKISDADLTG